MLSLLIKKYSSNIIGLYHNDELSFLKNIIRCNLKIFDYLDVTLNLNGGSYHPFHKLNEEKAYIHIESDHPPKIIKEIPRSIEKRLSRLSSTKKVFENSNDCYEQRLKQCGYNEKLN